MGCAYQSNTFCSRLDEETRKQLCVGCHIKQYARGKNLLSGYWKNKMALLLDGMMVMVESDVEDPSKTIANGLASGGDLISGLVCPQSTVGPRTTICLFDCTVAVFDERCTAALLESNVAFIKEAYTNCLHSCSQERAAMLRDVGCKDAYTSVRYVVHYCREHGLPPLTHEQIALVCNRSRPKVTAVLHELIRKEPGLFQPLETRD